MPCSAYCWVDIFGEKKALFYKEKHLIASLLQPIAQTKGKFWPKLNLSQGGAEQLGAFEHFG